MLNAAWLMEWRERRGRRRVDPAHRDGGADRFGAQRQLDEHVAAVVEAERPDVDRRRGAQAAVPASRIEPSRP